MPLRLPCLPVTLTAGSVLDRHFAPAGLRRPYLDVHVVGPGGASSVALAHIDTGADYTLFGSDVARKLSLTLPFATQARSSGAAGAYVSTYSFPPDGLLSLFVTDYTEYCYLPTPLIGFHPPGPLRQRSVLGLAGFLRYFRFVLDHGPMTPHFELHPVASFPGQAGPLPRDRPLADFIRSLRHAP